MGAVDRRLYERIADVTEAAGTSIFQSQERVKVRLVLNRECSAADSATSPPPSVDLSALVANMMRQVTGVFQNRAPPNGIPRSLTESDTTMTWFKY